jgi:hypothetical protein
MMPKPKSFVNSPQPGPGRLAIKTQISPIHRAGAFNSPVEHCIGNSASGEFSANRQPMDERWSILRNIGPEKRVLELKFYRAGGFKVRLSNVEKAASDAGADTFIG